MARTTQLDLECALESLARCLGVATRDTLTFQDRYLEISHTPQGYKVIERDLAYMGEKDVFGARRRPAGEMLRTLHFAIEAVTYR